MLPHIGVVGYIIQSASLEERLSKGLVTVDYMYTYDGSLCTAYCMARKCGKRFMATEHHEIEEEAQQTLSIALHEVVHQKTMLCNHHTQYANVQMHTQLILPDNLVSLSPRCC